MAGAANWLAPHGFLSLRPRAPSLGMAPLVIDWVLPSLLIKKLPYSLVCSKLDLLKASYQLRFLPQTTIAYIKLTEN